MNLVSNEYSNWINTDRSSPNQEETVDRLYLQIISLRNAVGDAAHNNFLMNNNICMTKEDVTGFKGCFQLYYNIAYPFF